MGGTFVKEVILEAGNPKVSNKGGDQTDIVGMYAIQPQKFPIKTAAPVTPMQ